MDVILYKRISDVSAEVDTIDGILNGTPGGTADIKSTADWATGSVNYANGGIVSSNTLCHADIDVTGYSHVAGFTVGGAQTDRGACFLDANGTWLWGDYNAGAGTYNWNYSFDVPQNAKTFRITCKIENEGDFTCVATIPATDGLVSQVEDLEDHIGTDKTLSIENKPADAKVVGDIIFGSSETKEVEIPLENFTIANFRIGTASGYWSSQNNSGYYLQIPDGLTSVSIKGNASFATDYAFLSSYAPVDVTKAPIVGNSGLPYTIATGETVTATIPETATYLYILRVNGSGKNTTPQKVFYTETEVQKGLADYFTGKSETNTGSYYQVVEGNFKAGTCWRLLLTDTTADFAEIKGLPDASDTSTGETQFLLYTGKETLWSPLKDYKAIRYGVNGSCTMTINDCSSVYDETEHKVFYCGASRQYTKLIDAIEAAERYMGSILYVDDGTYDLVTEFGANYFAGITTESMPGISLKNRIHIIFSPNSYVTCHYTGDNDKVLTNFSPFNCGQYGFTLENLNLSSSRVRYAIHDERNGKTELCMSKYVNCKIKHDNTQNEEWSSYSCIGGGLGSNHEVIIENCVFESIVDSGVAAHGVVYYHPSNDTNNHDFAAKVTVKDNYFANGTLELSGSRIDASIDTVVIFTNNSIPYDGANASNGIYFSGSQSYQGTHYDIKAWNNEMRQ